MGIAALMLIPSVTVQLARMPPTGENRWSDVAVAGFPIVFNLAGLPTFPSLDDRLLIVVGLVINGLTVWIRLRWL